MEEFISQEWVHGHVQFFIQLNTQHIYMAHYYLSYDVTSESEITPCNKIDFQISRKRYDVDNNVVYIMTKF